jgi:hypothetical protein
MFTRKQDDVWYTASIEEKAIQIGNRQMDLHSYSIYLYQFETCNNKIDEQLNERYIEKIKDRIEGDVRGKRIVHVYFQVTPYDDQCLCQEMIDLLAFLQYGIGLLTVDEVNAYREAALGEMTRYMEKTFCMFSYLSPGNRYGQMPQQRNFDFSTSDNVFPTLNNQPDTSHVQTVFGKHIGNLESVYHELATEYHHRLFLSWQRHLQNAFQFAFENKLAEYGEEAKQTLSISFYGIPDEFVQTV